MEDRNPSPPPEFETESDLYRPDSVGGTAISKQWVLATLMEIINEVGKHTESEEEGPIEVSDELQDSACKLWDICMDQEVAVFLLDFDIIEILYGVILKSKSPRLTEISVGILGNMACSKVACESISNLKHLRSVVLALLASPDTQTLIEVVRLIKICLSNDKCCNDWSLSFTENVEDVIQNSQFILNSSTNGKLLGNLSEVLDVVYEHNSDVLTACTTEEFINAMLEALQQQCKVDPSNSLHNACHSLHVLHTIGETESGNVVLGSLRQCVISQLSSLCYGWMTKHPKVDYTNCERMSSSEVSVSCCLSIAFPLLDHQDENEEEVKKTEEVDEEDRQLIIKFAQAIVAAKGVVSALVVMSSIATESENTNEFKTPLHALKNSPRINTPIINHINKHINAKSAETEVPTPVQSPEFHKQCPGERTPTSGGDGDTTPTTREHERDDKLDDLPPAAVLSDLAKKLLKSAASRGWIANGESPRKSAT